MMKIEPSMTDEGLPKVAWVQSTAETGETIGGRQEKWTIGMFVAAGVFYGWYINNALMMILGGIGGFILALYAMGEQYKERGRDPDHNDPILVKQYCEASLVKRGGGLKFAWQLKGKRLKDSFELPYSDVCELVVGGYNEWFAGEGKKYHDSNVIVMPLRNGAVLRLADHAGARSDMMRLHSLLTQTFVEPRDALLRREEAENRVRQGGRSQSDVPDTL
jgi:hypothetical protein